jgi:hypothetical protein
MKFLIRSQTRCLRLLVMVLYFKDSSNAFRRLRRRGASPANRGSAAPMTISNFSLAAN